MSFHISTKIPFFHKSTKIPFSPQKYLSLHKNTFLSKSFHKYLVVISSLSLSRIFGCYQIGWKVLEPKWSLYFLIVPIAIYKVLPYVLHPMNFQSTHVKLPNILFSHNLNLIFGICRQFLISSLDAPYPIPNPLPYLLNSRLPPFYL